MLNQIKEMPFYFGAWFVPLDFSSLCCIKLATVCGTPIVEQHQNWMFHFTINDCFCKIIFWLSETLKNFKTIFGCLYDLYSHYGYLQGLDGVSDPDSIHGGCEVLSGEKWSATKWMRQKATS